MTDIQANQMRYARIAGGMFLFVDLGYMVAMAIVMRLRVPGDFVETTRRMTEHETLYRIAQSSNLLAALGTLALAIGLYGVLKEVDRDVALFAMLFRVVETVLFAVQVIAGLAFFNLYTGRAYAQAFDSRQLAALVNLRVSAGSAGFDIAAIFFSVGSILYFHLFRKTSYIPAALSHLGFWGSVLVPIVCFGSIVAPQYSNYLAVGWVPIGAAEIIVGFVLLFKGVNLQAGETACAIPA